MDTGFSVFWSRIHRRERCSDAPRIQWIPASTDSRKQGTRTVWNRILYILPCGLILLGHWYDWLGSRCPVLSNPPGSINHINWYQPPNPNWFCMGVPPVRPIVAWRSVGIVEILHWWQGAFHVATLNDCWKFPHRSQRKERLSLPKKSSSMPWNPTKVSCLHSLHSWQKTLMVGFRISLSSSSEHGSVIQHHPWKSYEPGMI